MKRTIRGSHTVRWKAEDGKPGEDAIYYKLKVMKGGSVITSIPCDSIGNPKKVENVTVYLYRVVGRSETLCSDYYWYMSGMKDGVVVYSSQGTGSAFTFAVNRTDVDSFRVRVYEASNMGGNIIAEVMVPKVLDGTQGEKGYSGCISRVFENGHKLGQTYRNDSELNTTSIRYLDSVCLEDSSFSSGYAVYRCKVTHTATSVTAPGNVTYWEKLDINANAAFFVYLIAKNANIKMLTGSKFSVLDEGGNVCGCFCAEDIPFWIGGETPAESSVYFGMKGAGALARGNIYWNEKGEIVFDKGIFKAGIKKVYREVNLNDYTSDSFKADFSNGLNFNFTKSAGNDTHYMTLPTTIDLDGFDSEMVFYGNPGIVMISGESGTYPFLYNGMKVKQIKIGSFPRRLHLSAKKSRNYSSRIEWWVVNTSDFVLQGKTSSGYYNYVESRYYNEL